MRALRPNSQGILTPVKVTPHVPTAANPFSQPTNALVRLDLLRQGAVPRICIKRLGGIGDLLMTFPTAKAISRKYNIRVDYATDLEYLEGALPKALYGLPYVDKILDYRYIPTTDYDAIVDLQCPCVHHEVPGAAPINRIDLFARHVQIPLEDPSIDYTFRPEELEWAKQWYVQHRLDRHRVVLVQPFASSAPRSAPVDKIQKGLAKFLTKAKDLRAIVVLHDSDPVKSGNWNFQEVIVAKNYDIRQIAALMHEANLVLCQDSAVLHLASALHKPTVTLFGPTDPRARVNHHPEAVAIWPGKHLKSYPIWYAQPRNGYICWNLLEDVLIAETCWSVLQQQPLPESRDLVHFGTLAEGNKHYEVL